MKKMNMSMALILSIVLMTAGCASWNKTQKGAVAGTAAGGGMGAVIGKASGNTALGTIIGAAVGGTAGAIIGNQMDKQAEEIEKKVPDAKVERVGEGIVVEFSSNILFGFDKSALSDQAKANLDNLVIVLNEYEETDIEIQGHTDNTGSLEYNQNLSVQRADEVADYLADKGINDSRLNIKGFGETTPKYDNDTETGQKENRRVEFLITANEKMKAEAEDEANK